MEYQSEHYQKEKRINSYLRTIEIIRISEKHSNNKINLTIYQAMRLKDLIT